MNPPAWDRWQAQRETLRAVIARCLQGEAPADVQHAARIDMLDTLGCALAGRPAAEVAALEARFGATERVQDAQAFRFPGGPLLSERAASQVLAIAPTWHEACEGHAAAHGRPGVATLAALLPLALQRNMTMGELVDAFVLGYEVGARTGAWLRLAPGVHADGNWPSLGVAAGVAGLLGTDAVTVERALDIAACKLTASLYLPIRTGRTVRNVYLAHCAASGSDAAWQALAGFDAPPDALAWYAEHYIPASTQALPPAESFMLLGAYQKPFAAVRHAHYGAIAAQRLRARLAGDTRSIRAITLSIYQEAIAYCHNPQPQTLLAAQFSLTFGVAAMLRFGALRADSYEASRFRDGELRRLEVLVQVVPDQELTARGQRGASLSVQAGDQLLQETVAQDDPALVLDLDGIVAKFAASAHGVPAARSRAFCSAWMEAARDVPLRSLWNALAGD